MQPTIPTPHFSVENNMESYTQKVMMCSWEILCRNSTVLIFLIERDLICTRKQENPNILFISLLQLVPCCFINFFWTCTSKFNQSWYNDTKRWWLKSSFHTLRDNGERILQEKEWRERERLSVYIYHAPLKLIPSSLLLFASLNTPCND